MHSEINGILTYGTFAFSGILLILWILISQNSRYKKQVQKYSIRYSKIRQINDKYVFFDLASEYENTIRVDSLRKCEAFDFIKYFQSIILSEDYYLFEIVQQSFRNRELHSSYSNEILPILNHRTEHSLAKKAHVPYWFFLRIEDMLINECILTPITSPSFICSVVYDSPKGRSHHHRSHSFNVNEYLQHRKAAYAKQERTQSIHYQQRAERGRMTPSIRYDIMKRDGFRCVLCGKNASDGIKLHVDHILPIAKGGKTEPSNLRTLCNLCNSGKSAKYDPYGMN